MNYDVLDSYGTYDTGMGDDPYKMLLKMSSWNKELRSTISSVRHDMGEMESQIVQNEKEITNRVTYENYTGERVTSLIVQDAYSINLLANQLNINGLVTVSDLQGKGTTVIHGANIITGTILSDRIAVTELSAISSNLGTVTAGYIQGAYIQGGYITGAFINTEQDTYTGRNLYLGTSGQNIAITTYFGAPASNHAKLQYLTESSLFRISTHGPHGETLELQSNTLSLRGSVINFNNATVTGMTTTAVLG